MISDWEGVAANSLFTNHYWFMLRVFELFFVEETLIAGSGRHVGLLEAFPNDVDSHVGGVAQVAGVETIVAEFVEEYLVAGEIVGTQLVEGQEKGAFAELVAVSRVGKMSDRADGEDEVRRVDLSYK